MSDFTAASQQLAEATAALQDRLASEQKHVQELREQLEQDLDQKLPTKGDKGKSSPNPSPSDTIQLNVGGDASFTTRRDTLTAIPGSRLAQLFSGRWDGSLRRDLKGRVFLDLDPVQFRAMLTWLVDLKRVEPGSPSPAPPVESLPTTCRAGFMALCNYLCCRDTCVSEHVPAPTSKSSPSDPSKPLRELRDSSIVSVDQAKQLSAWLREALTGEPCFKLLLRASRDGFSPQVFHQKCDAQGPTVVIAKSAGGHVFGGYTETAWDSSGQNKQCRESFLFRLAGPGNVQPSKHQIFQNHQNGIYCHASYSPTFGGGHDMCIFQQGAGGKVSFNIGNTYNTTSPQGSWTHLAETQQAIVTDFEVFQVTQHVDLRVAAKRIQALGDLLESDLQESEQDLLHKALSVLTAALGEGSCLLDSKASLRASCDSVDEEASFLAKFMGASDDVVCLNVGGKHMETVHSTVTFFNESTLARKFANYWTLQSEEVVEGGVFFDEDPELFQIILLHLRLGKLLEESFCPRLPRGKTGPWKRLLKYLNLEVLIKEPFDSVLLATDADDLLSMLRDPSPDQEISLNLLFRASQDSFSPQVFHQRCDLQGPTVLIAKSAGGHVFGGYTETAWDSSGTWKQCQESFLFRLAGPGRIRPSKHKICQNHQYGMYCDSRDLATFGGGNDMRLFQEGAAGKVNFNIGNTYNPSSPQGSFTYLAEAQQAVVTDFEVFAVVRKSFGCV